MQVKLLTNTNDKPEFQALGGYEKHGGYIVLAKALKMDPNAIIEEVKLWSEGRGGGAGFPTGTKWSVST